MPLIPDAAVFRSTLTSLPESIFQPGETVLATGSVTERLLFLKEGGYGVSAAAMSGALIGPCTYDSPVAGVYNHSNHFAVLAG
jgi:hypothetical protein